MKKGIDLIFYEVISILMGVVGREKRKKTNKWIFWHLLPKRGGNWIWVKNRVVVFRVCFPNFACIQYTLYTICYFLDTPFDFFKDGRINLVKVAYNL